MCKISISAGSKAVTDKIEIVLFFFTYVLVTRVCRHLSYQRKCLRAFHLYNFFSLTQFFKPSKVHTLTLSTNHRFFTVSVRVGFLVQVGFDATLIIIILSRRSDGEANLHLISKPFYQP